MEDLFEREQKIFDSAAESLSKAQWKEKVDVCAFETLVIEYGRLLRHLRRITKISDKTTFDLTVSNQDLADKVRFDALTGIFNRRFLEENLNNAVFNAHRAEDGLLSIVMIDVDLFKLYNDFYGHTEGDKCLKAVAGAIIGCIKRTSDFAARYGGEEFTVVLPKTNEKGARTMAEMIIESVAALKIPHEKSSVSSYVTVSAGVTTGNAVGERDGSGFIKRADEALYISKQSGRNQYTFLSFDASLPDEAESKE